MDNVERIISKYTIIHMPNLNLLVIKEEIQINKIPVKEISIEHTQALLVTFWKEVFILNYRAKCPHPMLISDCIKQWRIRRYAFKNKQWAKETIVCLITGQLCNH